MKILFYSPFNQRSRDTESLMISFRQQGHQVMSLSQAEGTSIHEYLRANDVETYSHVIPGKKGLGYYIKHAFFLISFCKKHKVDIIYSHLEPANFAAVLAQSFIKAKVYIVRHHVEEAALYGFDRSFTYRTSYALAKKIIVVSDRAKQFMIRKEGIRADKIIHINLAYDFGLYNKPDPERVKEIKAKMPCDVLLITAGRMTKYKRTGMSIQVLMKLLEKGINAKLILLGQGDDEEPLHAMVKKNNLDGKVLMPGYVNNITDYLAASQFLLHPSLMESSCVVVKEAAITETPVIACHDVGDFEEYMISGENGFLVDKINFPEEATSIILNFQKEKLPALAEKLHQKIKEIFGLENVISKYTKLNLRDSR